MSSRRRARWWLVSIMLSASSLSCNWIFGIDKPNIIGATGGEAQGLPCARDRDCEQSYRCLSGEEGGTCINAIAAVCDRDADCPMGSRCHDETCRIDCSSEESNCLKDQICTSAGVCRGTDEAHDPFVEGTTGEPCSVPGDCESKVCDDSRCTEARCDDEVENGDESDVDCGGTCPGCAPSERCRSAADCEAPPDDDEASVKCEENTCLLVCSTSGLDDCNRDPEDGCEVNLIEDEQNCGSCGSECAPENAESGVCQNGQCLIDFEHGGCVLDYDDCDGRADNGCETNLKEESDHCGACDAACSQAHGSAACHEGVCEIDCDKDYGDCDLDARSNGCEIRTDVSVLNCSSCENECDIGSSQQTPFCAGGTCGLSACAEGKGDCDGDGTCTDDLSQLSNCGDCGIECAVARGTPTCEAKNSGFSCKILSCDVSADAEWHDCNGSYADGCEVDVLRSTQNCGGCVGGSGPGKNCDQILSDDALHVASVGCEVGLCEIKTCDAGFADCDADPSNGCEVNTSDSATRCGGCSSGDPKPGSGLNCNSQWAEATGNCLDSVCVFDDCKSGFGNCGGGLADGCETDTSDSSSDCGTCGLICQTPSGTSTNLCSNSSCLPSCSGSFESCDSIGQNGCETDTSLTVLHCGACGNNCNTTKHPSVNLSSCQAGACSVQSCVSANAADCNENWSDGCEVDLKNDPDNCNACGSPCTYGYCASGACEFTRWGKYAVGSDTMNRAANSVQGLRLLVAEGGKVKALGLRTGANPGVVHVRLALYSTDDVEGMLPQQRITYTDELIAANNNVTEGPGQVPDASIAAGYYWLFMVADGTLNISTVGTTTNWLVANGTPYGPLDRLPALTSMLLSDANFYIVTTP